MHSFDSTAGLARFSFCALALAATAAAQAATIRVPANKPTIQAAIDSARAGDKVLVAPGTYHEAIDFLGKPIVVISEAGAAATFIDAQSLGKSVATFTNGETRKARLSGFTLTHGAGVGWGGGVFIVGASPTIDRNRIVDNASNAGGGLYIEFGAPYIHHNIIARNTAASNTAASFGGGVFMTDAPQDGSVAELSDNTIEYNQVLDGGWDNSGGGIYVESMRVVIARNTIRYNGAPIGGGLTDRRSQTTLVNNLIHGNTTTWHSGGIWVNRSAGGTYVNNTVAKNSFEQLFVSEEPPVFANNIFYGTSIDHAAVVCATNANVQFDFNNAYSTKGPATFGACAASGTNLSIKPAFTGTGAHPYKLRPNSPLINKGNSNAVTGAALDLLSKPRVVGASVDMGAYELQTN